MMLGSSDVGKPTALRIESIAEEVRRGRGAKAMWWGVSLCRIHGLGHSSESSAIRRRPAVAL